MATHTGWRPRRPGTGGEGQNVDMAGTTVPFAPAPPPAGAWTTPAPRSPSATPAGRPTWPSPARAERLVGGGYLLPEDLDPVVQNAAERYDAFAGTGAATAAG